MKQHSHQSVPFSEQKFPLVLILDSLRGPANIGSLFRMADAFSVEKMVFTGAPPNFSSNRLRRTSRSTIENTSHEEIPDILQACQKYHDLGYTLMALEITDFSEALHTVNYGQFSRIALIVGNENQGVNPQALKECHKSLHINMFGKNSSMNVAQATAIALFEITKSLTPV